jgi:hypothetical protein
MNLWKAAHPSDTWQPQDSNGAVNNEFEEAGWYCLPCHLSKANASTPSMDVSTASISTMAVMVNALTAATTSNAASTGKVIDVDAPSNAIIVSPPKKRSSGSALDSLVQAGPKAKKRKDNLLYSCFIITPSIGEGFEGKVDACCKYCSNFVNKGVQMFNSSRGRTHSLQCKFTPENVKDRLHKTSQIARRESMAAVYHCNSMSIKGILSTGQTLASESMKRGTAISK